MKYSPEITLDDVIQADPTLRFFLREAEYDYDRLDWQLEIKSAAILIAITKWLDLKY